MMAARTINRVTLLGRLGRDAETMNLPTGRSVTRFTVATNNRFKTKDGEWKQDTEWHNCVYWNAEKVDMLRKGARVFLEGRVKTRRYEDKEGKNRSITEILVEDLVMFWEEGSGGKDGGGWRGREVKEKQEEEHLGPPVPPARPVDITDDDLPF